MRPSRLLPVLLVSTAMLAGAAATTAAGAQPRIFAVAGSGYAEGQAEDVLAGDAPVFPLGLAALPDGGFLVAEGSWVGQVARDGTLSAVAGGGAEGFSGDGGPAVDARVSAHSVAALPGGGFLIAGSDRVRKVDRRGIVRTVAGTGGDGFSGDGGPAVRAHVSPNGIAALPGGGFLIADTSNDRVREVDPGGIITTVAGTGAEGFSGDDGPATSAQLHDPGSVAALPGGGFLIADTGNQRVREVDPAGIITTVAGGGPSASAGEGGSATRASLGDPVAVSALPNGGFLIADASARQVQEVGPGGRIATVAGTGRILEPLMDQSFASLAFASGDGGPATRARFADGPTDVVALAGCGFLASDSERVRLVTTCRHGLLGMALGDPRRDRVSRGSYATHVLLTRTARVRVAVWRHGRRLAQQTTQAGGGRWTAVTVRGRFDPGVYLVRTSAAAQDGSSTAQARRVVLGGLLRTRWAIRLAGGDERTRMVPSGVPGSARTPAAGAADISELPHRITLCRRFGARRVDCEARAEDPYVDALLGCDWIAAILLRRDGQVYLSRYRCPTRRHPGLFKRHPTRLREPETPLELELLDAR